jgi:hypothetical protein
MAMLIRFPYQREIYGSNSLAKLRGSST